MTFKDLFQMANSYNSDHVMFVDEDYITYVHPKRRNGGRIHWEKIDNLEEQVNNFIKQFPEAIIKGNELMDPIIKELQEAYQTIEHAKRMQRLN